MVRKIKLFLYEKVLNVFKFRLTPESLECLSAGWLDKDTTLVFVTRRTHAETRLPKSTTVSKQRKKRDRKKDGKRQ